MFHSFLFGPQTQVRNIKVRNLPTGPHLRSATFGPQFTRPSVRRSASPHFTHGVSTFTPKSIPISNAMFTRILLAACYWPPV